MKTNKKIISKIIISAVIGLIFTFIPHFFKLIDSFNDKVPLSEFNLQAEITSEGNLKMEEVYSFADCNYNTQKREIITEGSKYSPKNVTIKDWSITLSDEHHSFSRNKNDNKSNTDDRFLIAFEGERDEINELVKKNTYVINIDEKYGDLSSVSVRVSYTLCNVVEVFKDFSNLNWNLVQDYSVNMSNVSVSLKYPKALEFKENEYDNLTENAIYYYGYGSDSYFDDSLKDEGILKIKCDYLRYDETIEVQTFFPSEILESENKKEESGIEYIKKIVDIGLESNLQAEKYNEIMRKVGIFLSIFLPVFSAFLIALYILLFRKVYLKYDKEYAVNFHEKYYRELVNDYPPAVVGYLYNEQEISKNDLSATLMNLIYKGFIEVDINGENQLDKEPNYKYIYHREKDKSSLSEHEKYLLKWYFDDLADSKDEITLDEIDEVLKKESKAIAYNKCNEKWNKLAKKDAEKYKFYESSAESGAKKYSSFVAFSIITIILYFATFFFNEHWAFSLVFFIAFTIGIFFLFYVNQVKRKTLKGQEDYVKWVAFRNFLIDFSRMEDYSITSLAIWDYYLVYATALGVADLVEKQLRTKYKKMQDNVEFQEPPLWYYGFHSYYHRRFVHTYQISQTTIAKAQASRSVKSSGRGGHHFGGGSSFGGGGSHSSFR